MNSVGQCGRNGGGEGIWGMPTYDFWLVRRMVFLGFLDACVLRSTFLRLFWHDYFYLKFINKWFLTVLSGLKIFVPCPGGILPKNVPPPSIFRIETWWRLVAPMTYSDAVTKRWLSQCFADCPRDVQQCAILPQSPNPLGSNDEFYWDVENKICVRLQHLRV